MIVKKVVLSIDQAIANSQTDESLALWLNKWRWCLGLRVLEITLICETTKRVVLTSRIPEFSFFGLSFRGALKGLFLPEIEIVVANQDLTPSLIDELLDEVNSDCFWYVLPLPYSVSAQLARLHFAPVGVQIQRRDSSLINLPGADISQDALVDVMIDQLPSKTRNMVRKGWNAGLSVKINIEKLIFDKHFVSAQSSLYKRTGRPVMLAQYYRLLAAKSAMTFTVSIFDSDRWIAGGIFSSLNHVWYYLSGASTERGYALAAPTQVIFYALIEAANRKGSSFDMGGFGLSSIDRFKRSFGGERVTRFVLRN